MNKKITLPSDQQIAEHAINTLDSMLRSINNSDVFSNIDEREKEVFLLALERSRLCAVNISTSLKQPSRR